MRIHPYISLSIACVLAGCSVRGKLETISRNATSVTLGLPFDERPAVGQVPAVAEDTLVLESPLQDDVIIMKAVRDEEGEMVATDVINAAMVTARFKNVAERNGTVELRFRITVPSGMMDSRWQLRFYPDMYVLGDTLSLDPVLITGADYRKAQLRGYQQYERFLNTIIRNDSLLINRTQLEIFLKRNIPQVYAFKSDTTFVSDEQFLSAYGVSEQDAVQHYTSKWRVWRNDRRKAMIGQKYRQYVKVPILRESLLLDTVMRAPSGDFIYEYVQSLHARPKLRKAEIGLSGQIFEQDKLIYSIPEPSPLTFYISSLSTLVDEREKFLSQVVERRVEANTACYIAFSAGKSEVDPAMEGNREEIARIEQNLSSLVRNEAFDLDSIIVTASASPEGSYSSNARLTLLRSRSVASFFQDYLASVYDSLRTEHHYYLGADGEGLADAAESGRGAALQQIRFVSRSNPENWRMLDAIVRSDAQLSERDKAAYFALSGVPDPDERESMLRSQPAYRYLRESLYPRLRTVRFDFFLHRRGMEKDTLYTTVPDTVYMRGVQAIRDRDYKTAVSILRPYHDYNTAVAYCSMDYNASALQILSGLDKTPQVNYLLAVLHSRMGRPREAVDCFLRACESDPAYVHRGNLDPEIAELIRRYSLDFTHP